MNKRIIFVIELIVLLTVGAAVLFLYINKENQLRTEQEYLRLKQEAVKTIDSSEMLSSRRNYSDKELAADYIAETNKGVSGNNAYQRKLASGEKILNKKRMLEEYYLVATYMKRYDDALDAAKQLYSYAPEFDTLMIVASAYKRLDDTANQLVYLNKAKGMNISAGHNEMAQKEIDAIKITEGGK